MRYARAVLTAMSIAATSAAYTADQPVKLAYRFKLGQPLTYRGTDTTTTTFSVTGLPAEAQSTETATTVTEKRGLYVKFDPQQLNKDGTVQVNVSVPKLRLIYQTQEGKSQLDYDRSQGDEWQATGAFAKQEMKELGLPSSLPFLGKPVSIKAAGTGKLLKVDKSVLAKLKKQPEGADLEFLAISPFLVLPTKAINVGDTWEDTIEIPGDLMGFDLPSVEEKLTQTLEGFEEIDGVECAKITYTGGVELSNVPIQMHSMGAEEGVSGNAKQFEIKVQGTTYFDIKSGREVKDDATNTGHIEVEMTGPSPEGGMMTITFVMDIQESASHQLVAA